MGVSSDDTGAATASPASLTFTTADWDTTQTVTVSGVNDSDAAAESVMVSLSASGGGYANTTGSVSVSVTDDDTANLVVSTSSLTVDEAGSDTFTVKLATQPSGSVTVGVSSDDTGAATASPASLTFTTGNWNTVQTVTVSGVDDSDTAAENVTVSLSASGGGYANTTGSVSVSVTDDDTAGLVVTPSTLTVGEAGSGTFTVKLARQPSANVTVGVSSDDTGAATASPANLTFTTADWDTTQTVTVSGVDDSDTAAESVMVSLAASGGGYANTTASVSVSVTDDDTPDLVVSVPTLTVGEAGSDTFTVKLATQPSGSVTVAVTSDDTGAATASPASLTFTTTNWNTTQTVTVSGVNDSDTNGESVTVSLSASGGGYANTTATVSVSVTDDDTAGLVVTPSTLTVGEAGDGTFTVKLATQPSANVTVGVSSDDTGAATASPANLTFTTADWDTTQTVTVSGVDDSDAAAESVMVSLSASGGGYAGKTGSVSVSVTDNDTANLVVSTSSLTVDEAGSDTFTVKLARQPSGSVTVAVTSDDTGAATASPASLTFTTGNWNTVQTVTVSGVDDSDTAAENVTVSLSASGGDYSDIIIASVTVTVTDNDDAAGICGRTPAVRDALLALIPGVSDCADVTAAELAAITGTLDLSSQSITALAAGDFAGLTALKTLYLFNNELTSLPADVFAGLTALDILALDNNGLTALPADVFEPLTSLEALYLFNNELASLPDGVFEPLIALEVLYLQGNPEAPFAPTADARPDDGTVPVAGGKVTLDGSGSGGPWGTNVTYRWALTTPANGVTVMFDDARSVTPVVTIPVLAEDTELTFTLTVTGRGGTNGINTDTDTAKVTATLNITNNPPMFAGGPAQGRTLAETVGNATVGTAAAIGAPVSASDVDTGDTLTYTLLGADRDKFIFDTSSGQIKTKVGEKYDYEAKPSYSVTVTVNDGTVTVSAAVTISVTDQNEAPLASDAPVASATSGSTTSLEVSWTAPDNTGRPGITSYDLQYQVQGASSWTNGPQDVSGTSASITGLVPDTEYEVQVRATNAEGDGAWSVAGGGTTGTTTPGITVSETALTVTEEDATGDSYTVVLDSLPTADVVVTVDGHSGTAVTPTPTTLTFATSNWNTAQTVTVTAGDDTDTTTDMVTLTHSATSTDGSYDGITIASVTVTVTDNDTANLVVSTSTLTVGEAGSDTFTVKLATQPSGSVTVAVTSDDTGAATASPASLTFTTGNWNTVQTVTVSGVDDSDTAAENVTVSLSASGGDYSDIMIASVTVTVTDNDDAAGICGRTPAVRDALLALIPGVSDCAAVTAAELAAITGTLDLSSQSITALAAGDFAGLTALKTLYLFNNELTSLPADVFGGLTALDILALDNNGLTALPANVFEPLNSLEALYLFNNKLTSLPADVFEPLTSLEVLFLQGNREAPFAPTADARPDDGTVPVAGGKVTLDGSGSSGPWGTNVTYRWALTTPANGVTVMFDDARSVTPVVTIPVLAEDTELTFTLTVTGRGGTNGISTDTDTAKVTATLNITNNPPMFAGGPAQGRTLAETVGNATVGTAAAIGAPVSASDVDTGDTLTYTLLGADRDKFIFDTSSGQIKTKVGEKYDYEAKPSYSVTVTVNDGTVTVSAAVTISVTDQNEAPLASDAPVASATSGSTTSLEVSWTAPDNTGRPGITSYDLQYQVRGASSWTNGPQDVSGTSASITGLVPNTEYEVQVRATNAEGDGAWSVAGGGTTGTTTPGITVSETALTVTEEDATGGSYTVVLDSLPTADVVVTVDGHSGTAVTPNPTTLTFATSNWNTAGQTVTRDRGLCRTTADTVTDNDTRTQTSSLTVGEAGSGHAATQPSGSVTRSPQTTRGRDGIPREPDFHDGQLEHGADGDGKRCGRLGHRRRERHGVADASGGDYSDT